MHAVPDEIGDAADGRGDDGLAGGHQLHHGERHPLEVRGEHADVERLDEVGDLLGRPRAEQQSPSSRGRARRSTPRAGLARALRRGSAPARPGRPPQAAHVARTSTSSAFCGRSPQTVPTSGVPSARPSSSRTRLRPGGACGRTPLGRYSTLAGSTLSISIIRRRSASETVRTTAAVRETSRRSRKRRSRCPSYDHVCSCATKTGTRTSRAIAAAHTFEPNLCEWSTSTRSRRSRRMSGRQRQTSSLERRPSWTTRTPARSSGSTSSAGDGPRDAEDPLEAGRVELLRDARREDLGARGREPVDHRDDANPPARRHSETAPRYWAISSSSGSGVSLRRPRK